MLALKIITGTGPDEVIVYDNRRDEDFRALWSTALIASQLRDYTMRIIALTFIIGMIVIAPLYWFLNARFVRPLRLITGHMHLFPRPFCLTRAD